MANSQQHETEIAGLSGLRLVVTSEVNQEDRFDEAKVKLLTGGDHLRARFMRQDHFTFTPTHHLWLMGNHQPRVHSGGESFWRRLRLIPFTNTVPDDKKNENLVKELLAEEGPGILAWIIAGAVSVHESGMVAPESVMAATEQYSAEEDALARFISDRCQIVNSPTAETTTAALYSAYTRWCAAEGERPMDSRVLGRELRSRYGLQGSRTKRSRSYKGIILLDIDVTDPEHDDGDDRGRWDQW